MIQGKVLNALQKLSSHFLTPCASSEQAFLAYFLRTFATTLAFTWNKNLDYETFCEMKALGAETPGKWVASSLHRSSHQLAVEEREGE